MVVKAPLATCPPAPFQEDQLLWVVSRAVLSLKTPFHQPERVLDLRCDSLGEPSVKVESAVIGGESSRRGGSRSLSPCWRLASQAGDSVGRWRPLEAVVREAVEAQPSLGEGTARGLSRARHRA